MSDPHHDGGPKGAARKPTRMSDRIEKGMGPERRNLPGDPCVREQHCLRRYLAGLALARSLPVPVGIARCPCQRRLVHLCEDEAGSRTMQWILPGRREEDRSPTWAPTGPATLEITMYAVPPTADIQGASRQRMWAPTAGELVEFVQRSSTPPRPFLI